MSLMSQNALSRKRPIGRNVLGFNQDNAGEGSDNLDESKSQRRKQEREGAIAQKEMQEMKKLESFLFGPLRFSVEFGNEEEEEDAEKKMEESSIYIHDDPLATDDDDTIYKDVKEAYASGEDQKEERKAVWYDEEEQKMKIDITRINRLRKLRREESESFITAADYVARLRSQHVKLNPSTEWAELGRKAQSCDSSDGSDDENTLVVAGEYSHLHHDILRTNDDVVVMSRRKLLPGLIKYSRLVDANVEEPSNGPINSLEFHRNAQLLLTAGLDKRVRFFQIDGKRNAKIQSVFLEDCPVRKASFLPDGSQVIISGRRKFFYSFDIVNAKVDRIGPLMGRDEKSLETFEVSPDSSTIAFTGNEGYILLVSSKTKQLIGTLKMNGTARALAFADDGHQLLSSGGDGHVYHWDLRTRKCFHKGVDEGCITSSALGVSKDSSLFASGSDSGIVNVYNRKEFLGGKKAPIKAFTNLTTKIDGLRFNHDGQILATFSSMKRNSLKLVHVPTLSVYSNWPSLKHNLQYVKCVDFSPGGGLMALGNAAGKVLLYKLHHYEQA